MSGSSTVSARRRPRRVGRPPVGRVGGLICWENRMPLARCAVYQGGPQIWVAPTADDSDGWLATMRHIAIESGAFVVSVPQYIPARVPRRLPGPARPREVFGRGGAAIVEPRLGNVIAGPLYDAEGLVVADCDLKRGLHAKRQFDAVGHYSPRGRPAAFVDGAVLDAEVGEWCRSRRGTSGRGRPRRSCSGRAASARSSTSSVSKSRVLVGSSSSSRSASEATMAAIAARARWPG